MTADDRLKRLAEPAGSGEDRDRLYEVGDHILYEDLDGNITDGIIESIDVWPPDAIPEAPEREAEPVRSVLDPPKNPHPFDASLALRDSILAYGVLVPVVMDNSGHIIDGQKRARIAEALGLDYPTQIGSPSDPRIVLDRPDREAISKKLTADGYAITTVAKVIGATHNTVRRDLGIEGVSGSRRVTRTPTLTDEDARALLARVTAGEAPFDIAADLGLPRLAVRNQINRARHITRHDPNVKPFAHGDTTPAAVKWRRERIVAMAEQSMTSRQIAAALEINPSQVTHLAKKYGIDITADKVVRSSRRHNSDRIVGDIANTLEGCAMSVGLAQVADLDPTQVAAWAGSIRSSIKTINRFLKEINP